jgi:hypothetical protein
LHKLINVKRKFAKEKHSSLFSLGIRDKETGFLASMSGACTIKPLKVVTVAILQ